MQRSGDRIVHSATDLSGYLACPHLAAQNRARVLGVIAGPRRYEDPGLDLLRTRGEEHEAAILAGYRARGLEIAEPRQPTRSVLDDRSDVDPDLLACAGDTLEAMRSGADVIYQGVLYRVEDGNTGRTRDPAPGIATADPDDGDPGPDNPTAPAWQGRPDFLVRVERPSRLGGWSYEVVDAKLSRSAKAGAVLQTCFYSDLLGHAQGAAPEFMHLALGVPGTPPERFRVADYAAYHRSVRRRYDRAMDFDGPPSTYPEPCEHCDLCDWRPVCRERWRADDHLSLVAGITRKQRDALTGHEVPTRTALGDLPLPADPPVDGVSAPALERIREQARLQVEGEREDRVKYELLRGVEDAFGLGSLPAPSPGDLFFDIEGAPHAVEGGREYLWGWVDADGDYHELRGLDAAGEKAAFEAFIDTVARGRERDPGLHVYHYNHYEPSALKRLAGRHATREAELDDLLRDGVFVDLYRVARQGIRASVESYSIKKLEPLYGFVREVELRGASRALAAFEAVLGMSGGVHGEPDGGVQALLDEIVGYNRDDCVSTLRLRDWLEERRAELEAVEGREIARWVGDDNGDSKAKENDEAIELLVEQLLEPIDPDVLTALASGDVASAGAVPGSSPCDAASTGGPRAPGIPTEADRARWILAHLLSWHRRENKSVWWEYFRLRELDDDQLLLESKPLSHLSYEGPVDTVKQSTVHRYRYPAQDFAIRKGDKPQDPRTGKGAGEVWAVDSDAGTIDLKRGNNSKAPHPASLVPFDMIPDKVLRARLVGLAEGVVAGGLEADGIELATGLLLRERPSVADTDARDPEPPPLRRHGESTLDAGRRIAPELSGTSLPVQGPPGSGKTYLGARMIVTLLRAGKRVGITGPSHKVIVNLLDDVCAAATEEGVEFRGIQKADEDDRCGHALIEGTGDNGQVRDALADGTATLAAGTAWLWAREDMKDSVDVLFVDEAGQVSLANVLAASHAAANLVLLGDPQQLEQPLKGVHPPGAATSALEHLVGPGTLEADRGLFLDETWRLHPDLCAFTSELFYEGRLAPRPELERQALHAPDGVTDPAYGVGVRFVPVEHSGNSSESVEEARAVRRLIDALVRPGAAWTDRDGTVHPLTLADVVIVAPYNAQVAALRDALPAAARVGTVDKFQGQEAAVSVYCTTTSTPADAPRGMEFLYNPNRLNVATSRAKCLAWVVGSPALFAPECRTVRQMALANGFSRVAEEGRVVPSP